jgi:hypothetical protein
MTTQTHPVFFALALITWAACLTTTGPSARAQTAYELPIPCAAVEKAIDSKNLAALGGKTQDPDVLLGLLHLTRKGDPLAKDLAERVAKLKPEYAPIATVMRITIEGPDEASVAELNARDADNALGHYLQATLRYQADRDKEALDAYRKAAERRELRLYDAVSSAALFKALDALELKGRERLCALSWVATRLFNFGVMWIQPLQNELTEIARSAGGGQREQYSDQLLILAGHLSATNFDNRKYAERALESAFRLKAEVAAEQDSPKMSGYAAVTQALVSTSWSGIDERREAVLYLSSRIYGALQRVEKPAPGASADELKTARALVDAASADPDRIVGAYLKGLPANTRKNKVPWTSQHTYVEFLMSDSPEVFEVAAAYEKAMRAAEAQAGKDDPANPDLQRMWRIGEELLGYAFRHGNTFPRSLQVLYDEKLLDPKVEAKSLRTGRPYVYVVAGQKLPEKQHDRFALILLYDDHEADGRYQCVLGIPAVGKFPVAEVRERIKSQGKANP